MTKPVSVFFSYSHRDKKLRDSLERHLSVLKRHGIIGTWHDRAISPGSDIDREIDLHLETSDLILLLVGPHFLASDYCWSKEMTRAMERHEAGLSAVVPIILRPCDWQQTAFGKLKVLPTDGRAVVSKYWKDTDAAFADVVIGIRQTIADLRKAFQSGDQTAEIPSGTHTPAGNVTIGQMIVHGQPPDSVEPEGLQLEWISGGDIGCDRFEGRTVGLVAVTNGTMMVPQPAFDLSGIVRYKSSTGQDFTVTNPVWWEIIRDSNMSLQGWKPGIEKLESGQTQYFILLARDDDGMEWAVRHSGDRGGLVGQLDYSQWELTIQVTSRNLPGRELVISYLRRQYGGAPKPHAISRRTLPPRV